MVQQDEPGATPRGASMELAVELVVELELVART
jgi:hypothetical protein